jgi:hypothetical protein
MCKVKCKSFFEKNLKFFYFVLYYILYRVNFSYEIDAKNRENQVVFELKTGIVYGIGIGGVGSWLCFQSYCHYLIALRF